VFPLRDCLNSTASITDSFTSGTSVATTPNTPNTKITSVQTAIDMNQGGPDNPFASLMIRAPKYKARPTEKDRYWVHDKVQDELRHDFRKRTMGKTGADVARTYFDSVPRDTTNDVDCENTIGENLNKMPELEVDQWKAVIATAFLDRCEKNDW
jgi:hypothetical protein